MISYISVEALGMGTNISIQPKVEQLFLLFTLMASKLVKGQSTEQWMTSKCALFSGGYNLPDTSLEADDEFNLSLIYHPT